ncbi:MAG: ActD-like protein [Candidatus Latescibacteria bacterium]|jgi:hypothetical protein|nr:ActD-like protein [Candidatus Latescibacterota bacterium]
MNRDNEHAILELKLERYVAADLPQEEMDRIHRLVESDAYLRNRVDALVRSNEEILEERPPAWVARQIRMRLEGEPAEPSGAVWWKWALPVVPIAAAVILMVMSYDTIDRSPWTGIKGLEPTLVLYRQSDRGAERLADGVSAAQGDRIQIVYNAAGKRHGVIFSVDGRGQITQHLPERGDRSVELRPGRLDTLDFAYRLDDAPRLERFYQIAADSAFEARPILDAAREAALNDTVTASRPLPLPSGYSQHVKTLTKE